VLAAGRALLTLVAVAVLVLRSGPAVRTPVMPGSFTGYAFDTCEAPSQDAMDAWWTASPYAAVGIYISGENRACPGQAALDAAWVATQAQRGWRLLPLVVGPQAPCAPGHWSTVDPNAADHHAAARGEGRDEASSAADAAHDLALAPGSTLWLDVEAFDTSRAGCRAATLAYVSGWTVGLRRLGYVPGLYSSATSGIRMLERGTARDLPRQVWVGDWNGRAGAVARSGSWRGWVHQYAGPHRETHGGVSLEVDSSFMRVGRGSRPAGDRVARLHERARPVLKYGSAGHAVRRLQRALGGVPVTGVYRDRTAEAVRRYQRHHGLPVTGVVTPALWRLLPAAR
jgi:hypothetical protein